MKWLDWFMDLFCIHRRHGDEYFREIQASLRDQQSQRSELDRRHGEESRALTEYERQALDLIHRRARIREQYRDFYYDSHSGGGAEPRNGGHA